MTYRFVGSTADLGDGTTLNGGDVLELDDKRAAELIAQRVAIVPHAQAETSPKENIINANV